jgi:hypothetical protein
MKRLALVLAVVLFGAACTDATAPAKPSMSVPTPSDLDLKGNLPPPPADAVIDVSVYSTPVFGQFTGVYFANGASVEATTAAQLIGDASLAFLGTAWLRLDNNQILDTSASANARFQTTNQKLFGTGTLVIQGETIRIVEVTSFIANPTCLVFGERCADITFTATIDSDPVPGTLHSGFATAYNKDACGALIIPEEGTPYYYCGEEVIGVTG